jgi:hypothetical protein
MSASRSGRFLPTHLGLVIARRRRCGPVRFNGHRRRWPSFGESISHEIISQEIKSSSLQPTGRRRGRLTQRRLPNVALERALFSCRARRCAYGFLVVGESRDIVTCSRARRTRGSRRCAIAEQVGPHLAPGQEPELSARQRLECRAPSATALVDGQPGREERKALRRAHGACVANEELLTVQAQTGHPQLHRRPVYRRRTCADQPPRLSAADGNVSRRGCFSIRPRRMNQGPYCTLTMLMTGVIMYCPLPVRITDWWPSKSRRILVVVAPVVAMSNC